MNIGIIGNPVTNISSEKFLKKFLMIMIYFSDKVFLFNDGIINFKYIDLNIVKTTQLIRLLSSGKKTFLSTLILHLITQIAYSYDLLKYAKKINLIVIFPVSFALPIFFLTLMKKKIILYEAQDIWFLHSGDKIIPKIQFFWQLVNRNFVINIVDYIIVEENAIIGNNKIDKYRSKIFICHQYVEKRYKIINRYKDRKNIIAFIGTFDKRKGVMEFALAIKIILNINSDLSFDMVGKGPLYNEVVNSLNDLIKLEKVKIISEIPEEYFPTYLNTLRLCVLPSYSEGVPNIILESMACGTPVLVTPVGGIPNIIKDGKTGFIMEDNSPESIARNVLRALNYPEIKQITLDARILIEEEFTLNKTIEKYSKLML